jgi:streptogramin lyase
MPAANASGDRIIVGSTDTYELRQFGPDGTATRVVRREVAPQDFTDAHFGQVADRFPQMASALAEIPRPNQAPAFSSLLVDRENNLWVQDYPSPSAAFASWTVFDPRGAMLGQVPLPAAFRPTDIGADHVLGVWTDELGVERIRVYSLRKP